MINLISLMDQFQTDDECREALESIRWPNGINCTRCGCVEVLELEKHNRWGVPRLRISVFRYERNYYARLPPAFAIYKQ